MSSKVVLKKKFGKDDFGQVAIRYYLEGVTKFRILGFKMSSDDFDKYFDEKFKMFDPAKFAEINKEISKHIDDYSLYRKKEEKPEYTSFIKYYENYISLHPIAPTTKQNHQNALNRLNAFLSSKGKKDLLFTDIDPDWVMEFRNYLLDTANPITVKQYLNLIKTALNKAKRKDLYFEKYNYFEKLGLKDEPDPKNVLSDNDIKILFNVPKSDEKHFYTRNMLLFSILCWGIRSSDLFLLRNSDLRNNYIEIISKKTAKPIKVPYSNKLIDIIIDIYNIPIDNLVGGYSGIKYMDLSLEKDDIQTRTELKKSYNDVKEEVLKYIRENFKENDFVFQDFMRLAPNLKTYKKKSAMTAEQNTTLHNIRNYYNKHLKKLRVAYSLDLKDISSHSGRYTWVNLLVLNDEPLHKIQQSLGHKKISITESYIDKHFTGNKHNDIGDVFSNNITI